MASTKTKSNKMIRTIWLAFLFLIIFIAIFFWGISKGLLGEMPTFDEIENPNSDLATEIYSSDSDVPIGKYYSKNRSNAKFEELPQNIVDALIATEDVRFYKHSGIDMRRTFSSVLFLGSRGGGSTITQQLAKNLFHDVDRSSTLKRIGQKLKEYVMSVMLERTYTKEEILTMYLNTVDFIHNSFGIKSAAKTYFNKNVSDLTTNESATLIGMLKGPFVFNPVSNPEKALNRKKTVIDQMYKYGFIDQAAKDTLRDKEIVTDFKATNHINGIAPHFREQLRMWLKDWATNKINPSTGKPYNIYKDGLKVYTTINGKMQTYAEEAVAEHLTEWQDMFFKHWKGKDPWEYYDKYDRANTAPKQEDLLIENVTKIFMQKDTLSKEEALKVINTPREMTLWSHHGNIDTVLSPLDSVKYYKMILQTGLLAVDPNTGYVKAWVGGANFEQNQFDHVNINTKRQVGSTFKPLIYILAIKEVGYSPCFKVPDAPICFDPDDPKWPILKKYCPKNSDGSSDGMMAIKDGLAASKNQVTAYLMHELNANAVVNFAHNLGIESEIPPYPSICLGVADISVYEMIHAYSTFANGGGNSIEPIFVTRIEDSHGNIIEEFYPHKKQALDEQSAYIITQMLRNVVDAPPPATGARVRFKYNIPRTLQIAGKTGTTQNNSDGWFMGYTPELLAGVWVGNDDKFVRFRSTSLGQGASTALPIWAKFIKKVYADTSLHYNINASFEKPTEKLYVELDCTKFENEHGSEGHTPEMNNFFEQ
ncbi:MAG: transglycosylase domain-containing protein [Bacteroidetes bacterium]|nr:transglycosylase domain-containing protein [Bacteroidota bacterium]